MNWIERIYEIKGKDLYSQNGEGLLLEYVIYSLLIHNGLAIDFGSGDGFVISNTRHLRNIGWRVSLVDRIDGNNVDADNVFKFYSNKHDLVSIDIDGNDYWILDTILSKYTGEWAPSVIVAEFNPAFTDSRTIKYNPEHEWAGDDYYGFSFEAGKKLAEKHGYEIIFNVANMNLIMVRKDLIAGLAVPPVTYEQVKFFKESNRTDWVWI